MRRYDDPVEVRRATPDEHGPEQSPEQFLWRGRLWKVRSVLAHWVLGAGADTETDPDTGVEVGAGGLALVGERELWRVRAGRGGLESDAVFDLSFDQADGSWQLVGQD